MSGAGSDHKDLCICTVFMSVRSKPKCYNSRHPGRTLLYHTVAEHDETWLDLASAGQFDGQGDHHSPSPMCESLREVTGMQHLCARHCPLALW